jgi:hypothetical protein
MMRGYAEFIPQGTFLSLPIAAVQRQVAIHHRLHVVSCLTEYIAYGFPAVLARGFVYELELPASFVGSLTTTCGLIQHESGKNYLVASNATGSNCSVSHGPTKIWTMSIIEGDEIFKIDEFDEANTVQKKVKVDELFFYLLPEKTDIVFSQYDARVIYTLDGPELPAGLVFDAVEGFINGTPTAVTDGPLLYTFGVKDTFSLVWNQTGTMSLHIYKPTTSPDFITAYGYFLIIPVVVAIIGYLIYWLYKRHDRRKLFHIFLSYRSIVVVCV